MQKSKHSNLVKSIDQDKIARSTLYVSLEPRLHRVRHHLCASISFNIHKDIYIGSLDPNPKINGNGAMQLRGTWIKSIQGSAGRKQTWNKKYF